MSQNLFKTDPEQWRSIVGYEGAYDVSSHGRVRSLLTPRGNPRKSPLILRNRDNGAYDVVAIFRTVDGSRQRRDARIHHLVAEAFIGPRPAGKVIDHRDGNSRNNCPANLRYVTQQVNTSVHRHLRVEDAIIVRQLTDAGLLTLKEIGSIYGVDANFVFNIKRGDTYAEVFA